MGINPINKMGMKQIVENSQRLNNYMGSVDSSLKELLVAFNENSKLFLAKLETLEKKVDQNNDKRENEKDN